MGIELSLTVQKAIALLGQVASSDQPSRLVDLVSNSGLSKTVCFRLLSTLESEGLIRRNDSGGGYVLGLRTIEMAGKSLSGNTLRSRSIPFIDAMARTTGDAVMLFVPSKLTAVCFERRDGDAPVRAAGVDIGGSLPLNTGGAPLALLSHLPDDEREQFLAGSLPRPTRKSIVDVAELRRRIAEVREVGFAIGDEDAIDYVVAVGAPIFGRERRLLGALSCGGIKPRYPAKRIREVTAMVCDAAGRISALLGGAP